MVHSHQLTQMAVQPAKCQNQSTREVAWPGETFPLSWVSTAKLTSLESCTLLAVLLCPHSYLVSLYLLRYECYCEREQRCLSCSRFMALHSNDSLLLPFSPIHKVPLQRL